MLNIQRLFPAPEADLYTFTWNLNTDCNRRLNATGFDWTRLSAIHYVGLTAGYAAENVTKTETTTPPESSTPPSNTMRTMGHVNLNATGVTMTPTIPAAIPNISTDSSVTSALTPNKTSDIQPTAVTTSTSTSTSTTTTTTRTSTTSKTVEWGKLSHLPHLVLI
ncbi:hypothetical protein DPX16_14854 [Anabarilius grahami]|uniref:Uncharacterized protein n=1 Tax=Anabarilius grahami TaxID=495550 RepID=A0A3N0YW20_ANAGA|nr:hypothetical protein DPX16_14854 [Anabarilius grahami]